MRAAMYSLKECCAPDCSSFLFNYYPVLDVKREILTLYFAGYGTVIPSGFTNCPTLSSITVTDGAGHTYVDSSWDFTANSTSYTIPDNLVVDYGLDPILPYTITITACLVSGDTVCSQTVTQTMAPATTTTTTIAPTTTTTTVGP
jgi:hypothetical protein